MEKASRMLLPASNDGDSLRAETQSLIQRYLEIALHNELFGCVPLNAGAVRREIPGKAEGITGRF